LFPVQIFITLMNEIGQVGEKNCCEYHQKSSKLLTHESLKNTEIHGKRVKTSRDAEVEKDDQFTVLQNPFEKIPE
jgi:hypothetical protein